MGDYRLLFRLLPDVVHDRLDLDEGDEVDEQVRVDLPEVDACRRKHHPPLLPCDADRTDTTSRQKLIREEPSSHLTTCRPSSATRLHSLSCGSLAALSSLSSLFLDRPCLIPMITAAMVLIQQPPRSGPTPASHSLLASHSAQINQSWTSTARGCQSQHWTGHSMLHLDFDASNLTWLGVLVKFLPLRPPSPSVLNPLACQSFDFSLFFSFSGPLSQSPSSNPPQ
eukprot:260491-Hanusia_phi.AAC.1